MIKKIFITILSVLMAFSAVTVGTGCGAPRSFTVTFDGGAEDAVLVEGELVQTVTSWEQLVEPVFNREGYNSDDWNKVLHNITSDTTVTQLWAKYNFTVTFNGNGGRTSDGLSTVELAVDSAYNLKNIAPEFIKQGYTLSWDTVLERVSNTCTINAVWTPNQYKVKFFDNDEQPLGISDLTVTYDKAIGTLPMLENRTIDGETHRFVRWETVDNSPIFSGMVWKNLDDLNVYAKWTDDEFIINYDLGGGNYINNPSSYSTGDRINVNNPTRYGYNFKGWSGTGIDGMVTELALVNTTGDKSFKANWQAKEFTLNLDAGNGTLSKGDKASVVFDSKIAGIEEPVLENYKFIGWKCYGSDIIYNNGSIWDIEPTDLTLVAQYKRVYTVSFSLTSTIRKKDRECVLVNSGSVPLRAGQSLEDFSIELLEGETLAEKGITKLPIVDPIEDGGTADGKGGDYSFGGYWKYSNANNGDTRLYKVEPDTAFNAKNFPGVAEDGVIIILPHCRAHWTPAY